MLLQAGHAVRATGRRQSVGARLVALGAQFHPADITHVQAIEKVAEDIDCVVHCAAHCSPWGTDAVHAPINIHGTRHVISACLRNGVKRLVHVSTPSLYFRLRDQWDIQEAQALPKPFINAYTRTKWVAERDVAAASGKIETVVIRPKAIFGPGDTTILPRLVRAGRRLGILPVFAPGEVHLDLTYVDNVAHSLVLACEAGPAAVGQIFNITNGAPVSLVPFLEDFLERLQVNVPVRRIPRRLGYALAASMEALYRAVRSSGEPPLTRYAVATLAYTQTLNIAAARRVLGYAPVVSMQEGIQRVVDAWHPVKS
jgi:nucleoside-diphosphate-sugar epimerase